MTPKQRLNAANEINRLWVRHIRHGDAPPDLNTVAGILERHEITTFDFSQELGQPEMPGSGVRIVVIRKNDSELDTTDTAASPSPKFAGRTDEDS